MNEFGEQPRASIWKELIIIIGLLALLIIACLVLNEDNPGLSGGIG